MPEEKPNPWLCPKCGGSGLGPSEVLGKFSGKPIPNCWTRCECNPEEQERYFPLRPDDIDYPVSYSYYRSMCQRYGWTDPGPDALHPQASDALHEPVEATIPESVWHRHQWQYLQQLRAQVNYLNSKVTELRAEKKKSRGEY